MNPSKQKTLKRGAHDKDLRVFGRAVLLRRSRIQGSAATMPCQKVEDFRHAAILVLAVS
jgi:hypothetical protein